jgi:alkylhydroperoxidase/carboxymuconolactone decarboxylase family protein YurZ
MIFPRKAHPVIYDRILDASRQASVSPAELHHYVAPQEAVQLITENVGATPPYRAVSESNSSLRDDSLSGHTQSSSLQTASLLYTDISIGLNTLTFSMAKDIFHQRGIGIDQLPPAKGKLLPLNEEAETQRATQVNNNFGQISPGLVQNTTDLLFRELWLRPALAPRDRSLMTVSSLVASRTGGTNHVSPEPRHGQRSDERTGFRGADAPCLLCGMA